MKLNSIAVVCFCCVWAGAVFPAEPKKEVKNPGIEPVLQPDPRVT